MKRPQNATQTYMLYELLPIITLDSGLTMQGLFVLVAVVPK